MPELTHHVVGRVHWRPAPGGAVDLGEWPRQYTTLVQVPQLAAVKCRWAVGFDGTVRWFHQAAAQLLAAFQLVETAGLLDRILTFDGDYNARLMRGGNTPSNHAFATALDLNAAWNPLGKRPAAKGQKGSLVEVVPLFKACGFAWGGDYPRRKEAMHLEIARLLPTCRVIDLASGQVLGEAISLADATRRWPGYRVADDRIATQAKLYLLKN